MGKSIYPFVKRMAAKMKVMILKYWKECSLGFPVATVLDPRFKMQTIELYYTQIYGDGVEPYIKRVCDVLDDLFVSYG